MFRGSFVMSAVSLLITQAFVKSPDFTGVPPSGRSAMLSAVSSSSLTAVCGIFTALFVCADYEQQTIKNVYARGFSKNSVYSAKLITVLATTSIMFASTLLFTYIAGNAMFKDGATESGNYAGLLTGQLIYCLAYSSFVSAVSLNVKKTGISIALAILGPSLIGTALSLADAFLKLESFKITDYWLDGFLDDLTSASTGNARLAVCAALSAVYAAVFSAAGYITNSRRDV